MDFGFWILDFGFWILDFGFWILDFGSWILDFGFWILDFGFWILDFGSWILDFGFWIVVVSVLFVAAPNAAVWILDFGFWILDFGSWILDFGFWILDFGSWILDFGFWILDFGFWILGTVWILHKIIATTRRLGSADLIWNRNPMVFRFHVFLLSRLLSVFVLKKYNPGRKIYTFSHNHGSGKWLYLKGNNPFGDTPIFH